MKELSIILIITCILLPKEISNVLTERTFFPNTRFNKNGNHKTLTTDRVVGGEPASLQNFPYQVAVLTHVHSQIMQCGGAIISTNEIATAAHCVIDEEGQITDPKNLVIKAGSVLITSEHMKKFTVGNITIHPNYNKANYQNDIAILTVDNPIQFSSDISSIPLSKTTPEDNERCVVSGWGYTDTQIKITSPILLYTTVSIINHDRCRTSYQRINNIVDSMICAQRRDPPGDSCQGDSGGPLVCNNKLVGIVSWGYNCGEPEFPGVYTNIASYNNWLRTLSLSNKTNASSKLKYSDVLIACHFILFYIGFNNVF